MRCNPAHLCVTTANELERSIVVNVLLGFGFSDHRKHSCDEIVVEGIYVFDSKSGYKKFDFLKSAVESEICYKIPFEVFISQIHKYEPTTLIGDFFIQNTYMGFYGR